MGRSQITISQHFTHSDIRYHSTTALSKFPELQTSRARGVFGRSIQIQVSDNIFLLLSQNVKVNQTKIFLSTIEWKNIERRLIRQHV